MHPPEMIALYYSPREKIGAAVLRYIYITNKLRGAF